MILIYSKVIPIILVSVKTIGRKEKERKGRREEGKEKGERKRGKIWRKEGMEEGRKENPPTPGCDK